MQATPSTFSPITFTSEFTATGCLHRKPHPGYAVPDLNLRINTLIHYRLGQQLALKEQFNQNTVPSFTRTNVIPHPYDLLSSSKMLFSFPYGFRRLDIQHTSCMDEIYDFTSFLELNCICPHLRSIYGKYSSASVLFWT